MPRRTFKSIHAGGFSMQKKRSLMNVVLPDKTTCISCKKTKGLNCFSELSKLDFKNGIATGVVKNPVGPWITCTSCTPKQVTELECIICYEVKGLEGFTKAQRKNPDSARCMRCVAEMSVEAPFEGTAREQLLHDISSSDSDDEELSITTNEHEGSVFESEDGHNEGVSIPSSPQGLNKVNLESLSLSTDGQRPYSTASQAVTRASATNTRRIRAVAPSSSKNVWQALARGEEAEAESTGGAAFVAYDANGAPHQKYRAPSTVDDEDSSETTTLDTKEQLRLAHEEKNARSKFAKSKEIGTREVRTVVPAYQEGRTVNYDDEDDDEDDDYGTL